MRLKLIGSYVGAAVMGLVLIVASLLLVLQWGNSAEFSLFGQNQQYNTALLMLASVTFGVLLPWILKLLLRCGTTIERSRRRAAAARKAAEAALEVRRQDVSQS